MKQFDYVKYDDIAMGHQGAFRIQVEQLSDHLNLFKGSRYRSLAHTALEEFYMWVGKMIRDDQIECRSEEPSTAASKPS